ncbi:DUF4386 family protein [Fulvivirga imtechensis]|uniref:DUF4386 family protein n=1 Tax=Fulvivirga imtechensis TaxID=881893 RepID=UPI0009FD8642
MITLEGFLLTFGSISLLTLTVVSKQYSTDVVDTSYLHLLGSLVKRYNSLSFDVAMLSLGSGGFILGYFLFQSRAVPRWIAVLGIIGSVLLFGRSLAVLMGYPQGFALFLPITLFEFIFPIWLIIKGFNQKLPDIQSSAV